MVIGKKQRVPQEFTVSRFGKFKAVKAGDNVGLAPGEVVVHEIRVVRVGGGLVCQGVPEDALVRIELVDGRTCAVNFELEQYDAALVFNLRRDIKGGLGQNGQCPVCLLFLCAGDPVARPGQRRPPRVPTGSRPRGMVQGDVRGGLLHPRVMPKSGSGVL